jgi:hypothetical protein
MNANDTKFGVEESIIGKWWNDMSFMGLIGDVILRSYDSLHLLFSFVHDLA